MMTISPETRGGMWADLFTSELTARSAQQHVTRRAQFYIEAGLPVADVLDALKIDAEAWAERVEDHERWKAENVAAGERIKVSPSGE